MLRRLALLLALFATLSSRGEDRSQFDADQVEFGTRESVARGHARFADPDSVLTADTLRRNHVDHTVSAFGHVVLTRRATLQPASPAIRILADTLVYHETDGSFSAERVRLGAYPYFAESESATGTRNEITLVRAKVTYGEPGPWQPTLKADKVIYTPGKRLRTENSQAGIGQVQPLPFPRFQQNLKEPLLSHISLTGGYRSSLGAFVDAGLHLPVAPGLLLGGDLGVYSARGVLVGPSGSYSGADGGADLNGMFRTGYINDHGDKKTDILGRPVPENRGFVEWQHEQNITDHLTFAGQLNWWKDSEVLRDFRPREFFPVQEPDTFLESVYTGNNYLVSAFARFQPNSFQRVQERLPEIQFDLLPTAIGGGVYEQFTASYARLRERGLFEIHSVIYPPGTVVVAGAPTLPTVTTSYGPVVDLLQADRLDAYYSLARPIAPTEWFSITPTVGGRFIHYANATSFPVAALPGVVIPTVPITIAYGPIPTSQTRTLGELGFDAVLRSSGTFAYKNETWKIDGLRHLFTPRISYRYVKADAPNRMPAIDRPVFSTYLQPLGLGDTRSVDTLEGSNILRLAFDNVLQTRDPVTGTRDLASLTVANDFGFSPGRRDLSGVQVVGAVMPASWLQFDTYQRYAPRRFTPQEFNTGLTLHDGDAWSVRVSNNFLRDQIEDYAVDGRARLNEVYDVLTRLHYDARKSRFNEQAYGLVQNLDNTWRISYVVSLYSGPRRESHFGLNVQIEATGF